MLLSTAITLQPTVPVLRIGLTVGQVLSILNQHTKVR